MPPTPHPTPADPTATKKVQVGTVRLLPEVKPDLCCNRCQPVAQALSDFLQLALMARTDEARAAVLKDFQRAAPAYYGHKEA